MSISGIKTLRPPIMRAHATLSQANPVSAQLYTILDTTANVRLIAAAVYVTWAVTQPTPLVMAITIDDILHNFSFTNPVSDSIYSPVFSSGDPATAQALQSASMMSYNLRNFLVEARSIKVQMRITWAVTQPTPIVGRVIYQKW